MKALKNQVLFVRFPKNWGLAKAFMAGMEAGLAAGADIIVNPDADNQYSPADTPRLVPPIIEGRAEIVTSTRHITALPFPKLGSRFLATSKHAVTIAEIDMSLQ